MRSAIGRKPITSSYDSDWYIEIFNSATSRQGYRISATVLTGFEQGEGGTVTSVALSLPDIFEVSGSPITTAGTLTAGLADQVANYVWAGPATGGAVPPTFRSLVLLDIPDLSSLYQPVDATLTALAAANWVSNAIPVGTGADTLTQLLISANTFPARSSAGNVEAKAITDFGLSLVDDADAPTARTTLGLGTLATQSGTFSGTSSGTNTGDQNLFSTIAVAGQDNVVADTTSDTLTLVAGTGVTLTTSAAGDSITITSSGSYTDEQAQDAVGNILVDSATIDITYNDSYPTIVADVIPDSLTAGYLHATTTDVLFGRSTAGAGAGEEIACTAAGRAILDDADAAAQRTTLGLGTLATQSGTFSGTSSGTNTGDQNLFSTISVSGQDDVVADTTGDTLTLVAGSNVTITTSAAGDSVTIASSAATETTETKTTSFTAVASYIYVIDGNSITATLPVTPTVGDHVWFTTEDDDVTSFVIGRNGSNIMGLAQDLNVDAGQFALMARYASAAWGWTIEPACVGVGTSGNTETSLSYIIDGSEAVITTGLKGFVEVPFPFVITGWTIFADQSGDIVVDVWKDTYANFPPTVADTIAASAKPTLSSQQGNKDITLVGWTTSCAAGDILAFNVDSVLTVTKVTVTLKGVKNPLPVAIEYVMDGGGLALVTGLNGFLEIPFDMVITGWTILADQSGSIVVDVWRDSYGNFPPTVADTIAGSEKPTISAATKGQDLTLTTWSPVVTAGSILAFNIDSASTVQRVTLSLRGVKT